ncbi:MAG TPA: arsenate reductase ArsC, partial [Candidatus Binatia bacterium]|nr:arsenate reductase ArsC [Candidatus Binatia bacterium]
MKKRVLFVCIHNSARSQMAEALLKRLCGDQFEPQSAGLEPGKLNPMVVEA